MVDGEYYGVCIPPELLEGREKPPTVYTDRGELFKVMKEFKGSRFKRFSSEIEAVEFTASAQPLTQPQVISTPVPSDSCSYSSLRPQEMVQFRKAIESNNLDFIAQCIGENPRYLMTPSDTPAILQEGARLNPLHVAAKAGRAETARLILDFVRGELTGLMYPEEDTSQNLVRRDRLIDLYLNMPDKGGGDTPLHLAAKFGNLEMVELLVGQAETNTGMLNKHGERAVDVVGSRARVADKEGQGKMRDLILGLQYIPVYKDMELNGLSLLGEPVAQKELNLSSKRSSPEDPSPATAGLFSPAPASLYSSPRTPASKSSSASTASPFLRSQSLFRSPLTGSPMRATPPRSCQSPLGEYVESPAMMSPLFLSAVFGPLTQEKATSLYRELKTSGSKQRLCDPARGLENQCRQVARREGSVWTEYWSFLGDYQDLSSRQGLTRLENHLTNRYAEYRRLEAELRCRELEDQEDLEDEMGELELVVKSKGASKTGGLDLAPPTQLPASPQKYPARPSDPLSPVSQLTSCLEGLSFDTCSLASPPGPNPQVNQRARLRRPSEDTKELLNQFSFMFSHAITQSLPCYDSDLEIQDWGLSLLAHWVTLRRDVNNMRSDPANRWAGLDYSALLRKLVEKVYIELETELDALELARVQALLDRILNFKVASSSSTSSIIQDAEEQPKYRRQSSSSSIDGSKLRDIQPLVSILTSYMEDRSFPDRVEMEKVWDIVSPNGRVTTKKVNKARKFLHSKVFSDSGFSDQSIPSFSDDFSWLHSRPTESGDHLKTGSLSEHADGLAQGPEDWADHGPAVGLPEWTTPPRPSRPSSVSSEGSSAFATPPTSPAASSMVTADEGVFLWIEGTEPTHG